MLERDRGNSLRQIALKLHTTTLIVSPLAKGLFHRAISQSGGYPVDSFYTLEESEILGAKIAQHLGLEDPADPAKSVKAMRELSWQTIVQGAVDAKAGQYSAVNIDGWLLPRSQAANETDRALTATMGQYWVNFAATGSPNGNNLPEWPAFTSATDHYQEPGDVVTSRSGLEAELCGILDRQRKTKM
jgi:carboxylesterase type B